MDNDHPPRLYTVKRDGTGGVELLRHSDVAGYLTDAERDPNSILLTEQLPDCPDVACITVLRQVTHNLSETWLCPYTHATVVPPGLQIHTSSMGHKVSRTISRYIHCTGVDHLYGSRLNGARLVGLIDLIDLY